MGDRNDRVVVEVQQVAAEVLVNKNALFLVAVDVGSNAMVVSKILFEEHGGAECRLRDELQGKPLALPSTRIAHSISDRACQLKGKEGWISPAFKDADFGLGVQMEWYGLSLIHAARLAN